jgi:N utilization substance protein B
MAPITRREAREQAFALVFEMIFNDAPVDELIQGAAQCRDITIDPYAVEAATAVREHQEELDAVIDRFSSKWKVGRLPKVTVSILRLAICEMDYIEGVPVGAVINEAVELAKKYGGDEDPAYVNGVLGGYARSREAATGKGGAPEVG